MKQKSKFKQTEIVKIWDLFKVFAGGNLSKLTFSKNKDKEYKKAKAT